jgi:acetyl esterase/lipase
MFALFLIPILTLSVVAQQPKAKSPPERPKPTAEQVSYGDHPRLKLDFWQAKSDSPTPLVVLIHGGGWTSGDKTTFGNAQIKPYLDAGISVAAINYRLIQTAMSEKVEPPVKAPLHDAARAIQFLRSKAKEWNLDKNRVGASGGSAGACTSLWLALHEDLANPKAQDPVLRESTRLQAAAVAGAQTSLDPKQVKEWMPTAVYGGHAFGFRTDGKCRAMEFAAAMENREKIMPWIKEYSPIELLSRDDPPLFLDYGGQKKKPVKGEAQDDPTHSALYGLMLAEAAEKHKVEVIVAYPGNKHPQFANMQAFLIAKLKAK